MGNESFQSHSLHTHRMVSRGKIWTPLCMRYSCTSRFENGKNSTWLPKTRTRFLATPKSSDHHYFSKIYYTRNQPWLATSSTTLTLTFRPSSSNLGLRSRSNTRRTLPGVLTWGNSPEPCESPDLQQPELVAASFTAVCSFSLVKSWTETLSSGPWLARQ